MKTLTGIPMNEIAGKLAEILPPDAYKAVPGGADLTDISPAYLTKVANDVFGLCGMGWKYEFQPSDMLVSKEVRKSKSGNERVVFTAVINLLNVYYALVDGNGDIIWSQPIPSNGASDNDDLGYAQRGAITNAIGAAFAKLGWQMGVYMGKINHHNAADLYKRKHAGVNQNNSTNTAMAEDAPKAQRISEALETVIPMDAKTPMDGKTLGEAMKDEVFGIAILRFLTGKHPNLAKDYYTGPDNIKQAAALLLANLSTASNS